MPRKKNTPESTHPAANPNVLGLHAAVVDQEITETLEANYMPYAMSVIVSRAIPEIDGFKPSHRKLLYTMYKMGLLTGGRTKSANIVGQTMRLNPHGDAAIYDTMVRLSKGYGALLTPFVDSKGNFGKAYSRDMAWAASRYTEAKLSGICSELFRDIDSDVVDFVDNYDNTMKEPALLPTTFPNILVSSNLGIAVGMASNICGFNLAEVCNTTVAYLKDPNCDLSETLLAPDFPTGGELLYDQKVLSEVYETGRGSIKVRAKWRYLKKENMIEIYEIPYSTTTEAIMDKVSELIKAGKLKEIADMRDETDLSGLKLTIDLKRGTDPDLLMAKLFKTTPLLDSFGCNFNVLVHGMPKVMGVREILKEWCDWRRGGISRRVQFILGKKKDKLHLLLGLQAILLDIDKAIKIIRETEKDEDVVPNLMLGFGIDEIQAEYVAEIKLRNINKEYISKRTADIKTLADDIVDLEDTLSHPNRIDKIIIAELKNVASKYGEPRRTEIVYQDEAEEEPIIEQIPDYPVWAFFTTRGYFKKITPLSLRMGGEQKLTEGDSIRAAVETTNASEVMFFTDKAQVYKTWLNAFDDTKASVFGDYLSAKLGMDAGENAVEMVLPGDYSGYMLFVYTNGKVSKIDLKSYQTLQNRKRLTGAYCDKFELCAALVIREDQDVALFTENGRALVFNTSVVNSKASRISQGSAVFKLKKTDKVSRCMVLESGKGLSRYQTKTLPATGAPLHEEDFEKD